MEYNLKVLGRRVREERTCRNLTIEQLAELVSLSPSYLGLVERGERGLSLDKLISISNVFGVTIDSLLKDVEVSQISRFSEMEALMSNLSNEDVKFVVDFIKLLKARNK